MTAVANVRSYRLSPGYSRTLAAHKKALAAPMIGTAMIADPLIRAAELPSAAAALRERRACQYAAAMARKSGSLPEDQSAFHALWDESTARVHFVTRGENQRVYASYAIPDHVLNFDPDAQALCLPPPEPEPEPPCELTAPMSFDDPAPEPEPVAPQAPKTLRRRARALAADKPARRSRKRRKPRKRPGMKTIHLLLGRRGIATMEIRL